MLVNTHILLAMSHNQIMIDLETMGTSKDAAVVAIGAVRFNIDDSTLGDTFYRTINLKSAMRMGGKVDGDTILWWMQQSEEARKVLTGEDSVLIESALKDFSQWVRDGGVLEGLWGNGADFDNVILEGAYNRSNWTPPWSYKQNRCYRTMYKMFPEVEKAKMEGVAHHVLDDAISQAEHLCEIWKRVKK